MGSVIETEDGLFIRECVSDGHHKCRSYTFTFVVPEDPAAGGWTVVAAGISEAMAYTRAYRCVLEDGYEIEGAVLRETSVERGEPGATSLYGWMDARKDCTFEVETP